MFSRAKRFDYYPKPEDKSTPTCSRCSIKHSKEKKHDASISKTTKKLSGSMKKEKPRLNSASTDDGFFDNPKKSISSDHGFDSSDNSPDLSRNSSAVSIFDHIQVSRSPSPGEPFSKDSTKVEIHPVTDLDETVYDSILEVSAARSVSAEPSQTEIITYLESIERKIDEHRQKISSLRQQFDSSDSGSERFESNRSVSPNASLEDRIRHVEGMSRSCVKETLEFITLYNKKLEEKCMSRPQDYKELVEFCSDLIIELSGKFSVNKANRKTWNKIKKFFRNVSKPFRNILKFFRKI